MDNYQEHTHTHMYTYTSVCVWEMGENVVYVICGKSQKGPLGSGANSGYLQYRIKHPL